MDGLHVLMHANHLIILAFISNFNENSMGIGLIDIEIYKSYYAGNSINQRQFCGFTLIVVN